MTKKLSALLTTAMVTGLIASHSAKAEETTTAPKADGDQMAGDKHGCDGKKADDKHSCKGMKGVKKGKKGEKHSCKNGCGEGKKSDKKDDAKVETKEEPKKDQ